MGNEAEFHFGKRRSREGLEFVGGRKRSSFREKVARIESAPKRGVSHHAARVHLDYNKTSSLTYDDFEPTVPAVPTEEVMPAQPAEPDPLAHIYQEPVLTPSLTEEMPLEPEEDLKPSAESLLESEATLSLDDETAPPKKFRKFMSYLVAITMIVILSLSALFLLHNTPNIPAGIRKKIGFTAYDIAPNDTFKLDKKSVQVSSEGNLVYFIDNVKNRAHYVISEQKIPAIVSNEADYQHFLADFDKYADADTKIGKAYFTRPANIGFDISVVVKTNTTLLFIRGPGTTSDVDWTKLLGSFRVVK